MREQIDKRGIRKERQRNGQGGGENSKYRTTDR